jgi:L-histidine N-alpha-methyltransferase
VSAFPHVHTLPGIAADVLNGLTRRPKVLPPRLFYDARGSALFDEITRLPQYYLTRTEHEILAINREEIIAECGSNLSVVELGAGSAAKTDLLLATLASRQLRVHYYPVDVSTAALEGAAERLCRSMPNLVVHPITADYSAGMQYLHAVRGRKLVLYLGSSVGNFEPEEAAKIFAMLRACLETGDALLLGADMVKPLSILLPAYDDPEGVTAQFNKNVLARINRELDADFDLEAFRHVALWNRARSRIEMHLQSLCGQVARVRALDLRVRFTAGERIHTESSYKYTPSMISALLANGGPPVPGSSFRLERTWNDARGWFTVHLARAV